jgi:hypothetical protein
MDHHCTVYVDGPLLSIVTQCTNGLLWLYSEYSDKILGMKPSFQTILNLESETNSHLQYQWNVDC